MIVLPWPSPMLSPNARLHWGAKSRAVKKARSDGFFAAKEARIGIAAGDVPVMVGLTFHAPDRRRHDVDNLVARMKAYLDGIADALGVDDNSFRLSAPVIGEPEKPGRVVVTIV